MASTPDTPLVVSQNAQAGLTAFLKECVTSFDSGLQIRTMMERLDRAYAREVDNTIEHQRAKVSNNLGDTDRFQNITVPLVLPAVENAVTYQASVFLQGTPIFGVVAGPQNEDAAIQFQTVIEDQSVRGGWTRELILAFRDGFKYNLFAVEAPYVRRRVASLSRSSLDTPNKESADTVWEGTQIKRCDLYNSIWDTRVAPAEVHLHGEFGGTTEVCSRIKLKQWFADTPGHIVGNVADAFKSPLSSSSGIPSGISKLEGYYVPMINKALFADTTKIGNSPNWLNWMQASKTQSTLEYHNVYLKTVLYARIIPSDFGLRVPSANTPQVWKFVYINFSVLVLAERCTNVHESLPFLMGQPLEDGLAYQTKSLAENMLPIQQLTSSMWNSIIHARRRAINDRALYDPLRISSSHVNSPNPSAKIPVKANALGKTIGDAYHPIPFRDDQSGIMLQETPQLFAMGEFISGQNRAKQGQFVKGNKTVHEFSTIMANANGRDQLCSMLLEAQFFTPLKSIIKWNILQYQPAGTLYNRSLEKSVAVDPETLKRAAIEFRITDGLLPTDKLISSEALSVAMQTISSSSVLSREYNLAPLFSYFVKTQGGRITEFEKTPQQKAYEQAMGAWQSTCMELVKANPQITPAQFPPQPTPEQYQYVLPQSTQPTSPGDAAKVTSHINNITNNIQRNDQ